MRIRRCLALGAALTALVPALAPAQDTKKTGITMGYPAAFGVLWHASDKLAIRPELSVGGSSNETTSSSIHLEGDGWSLGTDVSALLYLRTQDRLRTYVSPRFNYIHASNTTTTSSFTTSTSTTTTNAWGGAGSFGAQYAVGDRFTVFGEIGLGFTHSTSRSSLTPVEGSGNAWGTRAGVGVVLYP